MRAIIFNQQNMTAQDMGHYAYIFSQKKSGISKGLTITYSGSNINIASGMGLICGRLFAVDGTDTVAAPEVTSGTQYCRLVCEVDLSKTSTAQGCNQIYWKILQNADAYPTLTQQNLDEHPTDGVYQMQMAKFTVTTDGIGNWVDERQQFDIWLTGTIAANSSTFTVTDPSITSSSSIDDYYETTDGSLVTVKGRDIQNGSATITIKPKSTQITYRIRVF